MVPKKNRRGYDTPLSNTSNSIVNGMVRDTESEANRDEVRKQPLKR